MDERTQNKHDFKFAAGWVKRAADAYNIKPRWFRVVNYATDATGPLVEIGNTRRSITLTSTDRHNFA